MRRLPSTRRRLLIFAAGILLGAALAAGWFLRHRRQVPVATGPLAVSLWYWRQPFRIPPADVPLLREMGVNTLFVRAGTLTRDNETGALRLILPQVWATPPPDGISVHLVFNADYGVIRHLDSITDAALHAAFAEAIRAQRARAAKAGATVVGVQLDCDVPTRLLPRYATLLAGLRADMRADRKARGTASVPTALSITTLPTWLTSRGFDVVATQVDFFVPQFYEATIPQTFGAATSNGVNGGGFATIGDEARLKRGLVRAGRQQAIFWAGLPAYGHALVYDGKGKLRGVYHDQGILDLIRQPYYRLAHVYAAGAEGDHAPTADAARFGGEVIADLEPKGVGAPDRTNFHLVYDLPTATLFARQLAIVRADRPANCQGIVLFRYPEADATQSIPLPSLRAVWRGGKTFLPHLKVTVWSRPVAPWREIDSVASSAAPVTSVEDGDAKHHYFLGVTNDGEGAAGFGPGAVDVVMRFDRTCLRGSVAPGGFHQTTAFASAPDAPSSAARAIGVHFTALHLAPGQMLTSGPISVSAEGRPATVAWRSTGEGGFTTVAGKIDLPSAATNLPEGPR